MDLVERKRRLLPGKRRVSYQRDYMAERRGRLARALELRQLLRGPFKAPAGRKAAEQEIQAAWRLAKADYLAARGPLSWADRNSASNDFWDEIDTKLRANLAAEKNKVKA